MPVPINSNVVQLQQQPDYWTRLLANLMQLSALGMNIWQGFQNEQRGETEKQQAGTQRMAATNQMMGGMSQWGQNPQFNRAALIMAGYDPKMVDALIAQDTAARGKGRYTEDLEKRDVRRRSGQEKMQNTIGGWLPEASPNPFMGPNPGPWVPK